MADAPRVASIGARPGAFRPRARRRARTSAPPNSSWPAGTTARSSSSRDRDMTRSVWKGPFVDGYLLRKAEAARSSGRHEMIKIWSRRSTILPQFVGGGTPRRLLIECSVDVAKDRTVVGDDQT